MIALAVQTAPAADDVIVIAEKLRRLRLATSAKDGRLTGCEVRVSSGDARVDEAACAAMDECVNHGVAQSEALANCVDARVAAYMRRRSDTSSESQ